MLVLSRKHGESIIIGDDVIVTITQISGDRVRVGVDAPRQIPIMRGELVPPDVKPDTGSQRPAN